MYPMTERANYGEALQEPSGFTASVGNKNRTLKDFPKFGTRIYDIIAYFK